MGGRWRYRLTVSSNCTNCTMQHFRITLALQTSIVLKLYKLYNADISEFMGGRWRYKLLVSLNMSGHWRYKLLVSLNFTDCTMQTCQNSWVEVGVTNFSVLKLYKPYNADISEIMGGRWRYKPLLSLSFTDCAMQTYQNSWVDVGIANF